MPWSFVATSSIKTERQVSMLSDDKLGGRKLSRFPLKNQSFQVTTNLVYDSNTLKKLSCHLTIITSNCH